MHRILLAMTLGTALLMGAQKGDRPETQLQSAINMEVVQGDLKGAIEQYKKLAQSANRAVAASALVRMGQCYEKLGDAQAAEARKAYERVVRDYSDQKEALSVARARLGNRERSVDSAMLLRKVWEDQRVSYEGHVSPDGRYVSYPDWRSRNLGVHDLVTGTDVLLTNDGNGKGGYAQGSAFSRDGKQIAYAWFNGKNRYELRAVAVQSKGTPEPRRLFDSEEVDFLIPFDWTPDGKQVVVGLWRKDRSSQLGLISISDGSLRVLKSFRYRFGFSRVCLSPGGEHLAFDMDTSEDHSEADVFVLSLDGSRETRVVENPGHDYLMSWSPDGRYLLFASDRTGTMSLWAIPVVAGQAQGQPFLVKPNFEVPAIGISSTGALFTVTTVRSGDVRIALLDFATGKVLEPARSPVRTYVGANGSPDWSPDGKYLAYVSMRGTGFREHRVIVIRSVQTGEDRELPVTMDYLSIPRWSPDSRSFIVQGTNIKGEAGVFQIDAQTGAATRLVADQDSGFSVPQWSPNGKKIYYWGGQALRGTADSVFYERDLASGSDRKIYGGQGPVFPCISPDGRYLAGRVNDAQSSALVLIAVDSGERKELIRVKEPQVFGRYVSWFDGRNLLVGFRDDKDGKKIMIVPIDGGAPRTIEFDIAVGDPLGGIRVHPDGQHIAFSISERGMIGQLWTLEKFLPNPIAEARARKKPTR